MRTQLYIAETTAIRVAKKAVIGMLFLEGDIKQCECLVQSLGVRTERQFPVIMPLWFSAKAWAGRTHRCTPDRFERESRIPYPNCRFTKIKATLANTYYDRRVEFDRLSPHESNWHDIEFQAFLKTEAAKRWAIDRATGPTADEWLRDHRDRPPRDLDLDDDDDDEEDEEDEDSDVKRIIEEMYVMMWTPPVSA